jgi:hypothetical protein
MRLTKHAAILTLAVLPLAALRATHAADAPTVSKCGHHLKHNTP